MVVKNTPYDTPELVEQARNHVSRDRDAFSAGKPPSRGLHVWAGHRLGLTVCGASSSRARRSTTSIARPAPPCMILPNAHLFLTGHTKREKDLRVWCRAHTIGGAHEAPALHHGLWCTARGARVRAGCDMCCDCSSSHPSLGSATSQRGKWSNARISLPGTRDTSRQSRVECAPRA